jgi:hypothetical protein
VPGLVQLQVALIVRQRLVGEQVGEHRHHLQASISDGLCVRGCVRGCVRACVVLTLSALGLMMRISAIGELA